jgi:superfamily II DNA or RNA helicase
VQGYGQVRARHVLGLSATLVRRDGLQPILFMQCGPIRHTAQRPAGAPQTLELVSRTHQLPALPADLPIQELMRRLAENQPRTDRIVAEALHCWGDGRKLLLLSERTDHITAIAGALAEQVPNLFLLHGRLSARQRSASLAALEQLPPEAPRIVLATGRLVGEGFDHPPLDTLLLAMPVSWKGTLQQYAGGCTGSRAVSPAFASSTGSSSAIRCRSACGNGDCEGIGRWGTS